MAKTNTQPEEVQRDIDMMLNAANEIKRLRAENEKMRLRLNMFDNMMTLFNNNPPECRNGCSEDIAWALDKRVEQLVQQRRK